MDPPIDVVDHRSRDNLRQHVEQHSNGAVHIFTGNEKQRKVLTNPVIYDMNADRVRPRLDNEWANYENTSNRQAQENYNNTRKRIAESQGGQTNFDMYRNVVENALNVAFLAANTNQLRLLTEYQQEAATYEVCVGMVIMSLILQILVGVSMMTISINNEQRWQKLKTVASVGVAVIAVINIVVLSLLNAVMLQ